MPAPAPAVAANADSTSESILIWWPGDPPAAETGWTSLHHLDGGTVGLLPAGDIRRNDPGVVELGAYGPDALFFVSPSTYALLQQGEMPPAWRSVLPASGPGAPSPAELEAIPALARDRAQVLIRLPESMRAVTGSPGGRCRPLGTPAEAAERETRATARADAWRGKGIDPAAPSRIDEARTQPPEYWQSLVRAVSTDHFDADLDYLSTTLLTRYAYTPQMNLACQYVYDQFAELGLQTSFDEFTWNGHALKNVLAVKPGTVDPTRIYLIEGHLDAISPSPQTLAPGADDNGSGAVAVLEAARLLAGLPSDYTIYFLCVTAEEQGLIGSEHFAATADQQNLDIRGVLDFDMIGWYDPAGADLWIEGFRQGVSSLWLMQLVQQNAQTYAGLTTYLYPGEGWGSDHEPFHDHGFPAMLSIENEWDAYPCYHRTCDTVDQLTSSFWKKITAANVVTLGQLAQAQGALGGIAGTVTVAGGGDPQGATLRLSGTTYAAATSGVAGEFALGAIFPARYALLAEMPGYAPVTTEVVVPSGGIAQVEVVFDGQLPGSVRGVVRTRNGMPLSGARVDVEGQPVNAVSGLDGSFTLAPVLPGPVNLSASYSGMFPRGVTAQLAPGQNLAGVELVLASSWDFEGTSEGLVPSAGWEWGADAVAGAHSGNKVWGTVLGADYADCADYRLDFPAINLRSYAYARLRLWSWCRTQAGADGGNVQISTDGGQTWVVITPTPAYDGTLSGPCNALAGEAGLTGASGAWVERTYPLDAYIGRWVHLRLHFGADGTVADRGWYVDDLGFEGTFGSSSAEDHGGDGRGSGTPGTGAPPQLVMSVGPNPSTRGAVISVRLESGIEGSLAIFGSDGRRVATLCAPRRFEPGLYSFTWDGNDAAGRTVAAGTYWARFDGDGASAARPVIRLR